MMPLTRLFSIPALATVLCTLMAAACQDPSQDSTLQPKARPDSLSCPEIPDRAQAKLIVYNKLGSLSVMFNALSTNPKAIPLLIDNALHARTYDRVSYPDIANEYLSKQLEDTWSRELMRYIASCALAPHQSVSWTDPATRETTTWTGESGMCPQWHESGIATNTACQELVSACILARNNALGAQVRISMRGVQGSTSLPLSPALPGGIPSSLDSTHACTDMQGSSTAQDCGWSVEHVGMCQAGMPVKLSASSNQCAGERMARVCAGTGACDSDGPVVATTATLCSSGIEFACPDKGSFTVMQVPLDAASTDQTGIRADRAIYPVSEQELYTWREGAFYGNIFSVESLDPRISVEVTDSGLTYRSTVTQSPAGGRPLSIPISCARNDRTAEARLSWHEWFLRRLALEDGFVVHRNMFACWDPVWTEGAAYAAERICAGPTGAQVCAARTVGPCWDSLSSSNNLCATDDSPITRRDRDYDRCADDLGQRWEHPVTVFLDDPCAIVPGACGAHGVSAIVAGGIHTCALTTASEVRCWGSNSTGQLGYGNTTTIGDTEAPAAAGYVDIGGAVSQLALGSAHSCALLDTGDIRCWGYNSNGQLGYGNTTTIGDNETPASAGNVDIGGTAIALAAGAYHTCALLDTGHIRCWGANGFGQLGYANTSQIGDTETPASVGTVDIGGTAVALAAGAYHTCALLDTGHIRCWGYNFNGQLGYGHRNTIGDTETPASVGNVDIGGTAVALAAGSYHTCALLDTGVARCWGANSSGQLGYGNTTIIGDTEHPADINPIDAGGTIVQIAGGGSHTCALLSTGQIRCWGSSTNGQLGYGNRNSIGDNENITDVGPVDIGATVSHVALGASHTCALLSTGGARCWGQNWYGQLGYGNTAHLGDDEPIARAGNIPVF